MNLFSIIITPNSSRKQRTTSHNRQQQEQQHQQRQRRSIIVVTNVLYLPMPGSFQAKHVAFANADWGKAPKRPRERSAAPGTRDSLLLSQHAAQVGWCAFGWQFGCYIEVACNHFSPSLATLVYFATLAKHQPPRVCGPHHPASDVKAERSGCLSVLLWPAVEQKPNR